MGTKLYRFPYPKSRRTSFVEGAPVAQTAPVGASPPGDDVAILEFFFFFLKEGLLFPIFQDGLMGKETRAEARAKALF